MKCAHCRGAMRRGTSRFHVEREGYRLTLEAVPAWVCPQCGEVYFEEHEVGEIQEAIEAMDVRAQKICG